MRVSPLLAAIFSSCLMADNFIEPKAAFLSRLDDTATPKSGIVILKIQDRFYSAPGSCFSPRALASHGAGHILGSQMVSRDLAANQKGRDIGGDLGGRDLSSGNQGRLTGSGSADRMTGQGADGANTGSQQQSRDLGAGKALGNRGSEMQTRSLGEGVSERKYSSAVMDRLTEWYGLDRLLGSDEMPWFVDGKMVNRIFGSDFATREPICVPTLDGLGFHIAGIRLREDYQLYVNGVANDATLDENRHLYVAADLALYLSQ
ncbi:hypothetical protein [Pleionea sediminis]|uniref:hypothetical protein n=1 Tax=Pleionea sediminis TaxID=2569479 RepID=UPI001184E5DD|nr:hypothetical protein [Pleionea sediminis]